MRMTVKPKSFDSTNTGAMAQVSLEGPVDLCCLQRGWWQQLLVTETLKRVKWFVSPMRPLQTACTPLASQGKWSGLVPSKTTQLSQAFIGTFFFFVF